QALAGDIQRGGAGQPPLPQAAEGHLPSPDASRHQGPAGVGPEAGSPGRGPLRNDLLPSPNTRITPNRQLPCYRLEMGCKMDCIARAHTQPLTPNPPPPRGEGDNDQEALP